MQTILLGVESGHSQDHHVRIVVVAGVLCLGMNALIEVLHHLVKRGFSLRVGTTGNNRSDNVATHPPDILDRAAYAGSPSPRALLAPIANRVIKPLPADLFRASDGASDFAILHIGAQVLLVSAAPVDLDEIEAPLRKLQEVLLVMPFTAHIGVGGSDIREHRASIFARVG